MKKCYWCKKEGLVWYRTKAGKWALAEPKPGTTEADPHKVHLCTAKQTEKALRRVSSGHVGRQGTKSYKPSTWRR